VDLEAIAVRLLRTARPACLAAVTHLATRSGSADRKTSAPLPFCRCGAPVSGHRFIFTARAARRVTSA